MGSEVAAAGLGILWEAIGRDITNQVRGFIGQQWQKVDWRQAAETYRQNLEKQQSTLRILSKTKSVGLEDIFTHVYILDQLTAHHRLDIEDLCEQLQELQRQQAEEIRLRYHHEEMPHRLPVDFDRFPSTLAKRVNGLDLVHQGKNLFILGKPGAGKTTFLKYIALQAVRGKLPRTPIFISLHDWAYAQTQDLLPFIIEQFRICNFPDAQPFIEYLLRAGKAIVLFDGLDEVKQENSQRSSLTRALNDFMKQYDQNQFLITCRLAASGFAFYNMEDVEVADFSPGQVQEFAHKWFSEDPRKCQRFIQELAKPENAGVRELCTVPLLLSMICLAFEVSMRFPRRRSELYYDAMEVLLRAWDIEHRSILRDDIIKGFDFGFGQKLQLFAEIGGPAFAQGEYLFKEENLIRQLSDYVSGLPGLPSNGKPDGYKILKSIEAQHSIFMERAWHIYSFSHLTFQEYFTARYLIDNSANDFATLLQAHLTDSRWREVFLLTASMLPNTQPFFEQMQQTINALVSDDPLLLEILAWATEKAAAVADSATNPSTLRLIYLFLAQIQTPELPLDFSLVNDLEFSTTKPSLETLFGQMNALNQVVSLDMDFARAGSLVCNFALDLAFELTNHYGWVLGLDYSLLHAYRLALIIGKLQDADNVQRYVVEYATYFNDIMNWCEHSEIEPFKRTLSALALPTKQQPQANWLTFADSFRVMLQTHRRLGEVWELDRQQAEQLNNYFRTTGLLVQCLNLAHSRQRQYILANLLLSPPSYT